MAEQTTGKAFENTGNTGNSETTATEEKTMPTIDSKYRMIILAAQRSKQLQRGATPRIELDPRKTKPTRIALKEIENGKIDFETLLD